MLVYGDHSEIVEPPQRVGEIGEQLGAIAHTPPGLSRHAALVSALIAAGELLQGVADHEFRQTQCDRRSPATDGLTDFTGALARAVVRSWDSGFRETGELPPLAEAVCLPETVEVRTPEGFAFYAVYPEAYVDAARRLDLAGRPRVIGIRSIGTTLAAVVAAALDAPPPITVRPLGDPFARRMAIALELESELLSGDAHYVVVDEGPGLSGSSFGAVAEWLEQRGVPAERIAFVPSHGGAPGQRASDEHRKRWQAAQRVPGDWGDELPILVRQWVADVTGAREAPLVELSAGEWRRHVYRSEGEWPATVPAWERRKFLVKTSGSRFLARFAGLGAIGERKLAMARALHVAGLTPEPVGLAHGLLVERWRDDARPLDRHEKPTADVARYIGTRARLFPAAEHSGASLTRLLEMCRRNVSLALGPEAASRLGRWDGAVDRLSRRIVRIRTDNKLDRHEWLRLPDRRLIKTDALDHHCGHDLVGCQDIAWDVAAAIAEFELNAAQANELVVAAQRWSGRDVDHELLEFYRVAYAAFRLAWAAAGAEMCSPGDADRQRLEARASRYSAQLQQLLLQGTRGAIGRNPWSVRRRNEPLRNKGRGQSVDEEDAALSC